MWCVRTGVCALAVGLAAASGPVRAGGPPLKVVLVSGSGEYKSAESLPVFAKHLEAGFNVKATVLQAKGDKEIPGLEALDDADVMLVFTRRVKLEGDQLERFKKYCLAGKPIVGVRTASHAIQTWLDLDKEVFGGNYKGHYGGGVKQAVTINPDAKDHPVLKGVRDFESEYSLYKTGPIAADATLLMTSATPKAAAPEPAAWVREYKGARIFYTSLGGLTDFENASFRQMLVNALFWTAKREVEAKP
ncbi:MAG TPA: ThuA domain-containing protein [Planctomycetota bacterium]|nr:ThuA domain-containing protein [Planctomycetota bacterium]